MSSIFLSGTSLVLLNLLHCLIVRKSSRVCFFIQLFMFFLSSSFVLIILCQKQEQITPDEIITTFTSLILSCDPSPPAFVVPQQAGAARKESWEFNDFEFNPNLYQCS